MYSLTINQNDNVAWHRQVASGWARRLSAGVLPGTWAQDTAAEIRFALKALDLQAGDRLLDLGCGWGRHSLQFAAHGVHVTGVDISHELLTVARDDARRQQLAVEWLEADITELPLVSPYDAVAQFCDNFLTWFADREQALDALWHVVDLLRPGGRLLIGTASWQAELPKRRQEWDEWHDGAAIYRHRYDQQRRVAHSQTVVFGPQHERQEYHCQRWWPSRSDMESLFERVGLVMCGQFNRCSDAAYEPREPGLVYVLERGI